MSAIPAFLRSEGQPPVEAYHPTTSDASRCLARRTNEDYADRRWTKKVYGSFQCKSLPVAGSDLCETCMCREARYTITKISRLSDWHGRLTDEGVPADSQMAGSVWFYYKTKWTGVEKPRTRRMEERSDKRRPIADVELRRFADGIVPLDIERLSTENQISGQQLRDIVCRMTNREIGADRINGYETKVKLCELIRKIMEPIGEGCFFTAHYPEKEKTDKKAAAKAKETATAPVPEDSEKIALKAALAAAQEEIAALKAKLAAVAAAISS